ncbi:hypothetical protein FRACYDRAFT_248017 [Fragilariopsis cylindrus CCMP1102]|uniref:Uncharacterized protein n=1 Tax=Fragilariopsis cylindrus CCMP1102 TaxID=635003 RepID=A0A1E7EUR0_9STRA|nr:hypothetical protein FRACYDRAFT_248017 [Fragilariopsis cylindrus CCMP1102]|eukprot:OEU09760.1 hypothetical protein FRACYDRAFT_248017 [Fragilariopsis cylindrus CCMP1102]
MNLLTVQRSILIWSTIAYYWAALFTDNYDSVSAFVGVAPYHPNLNGLTSHCRKNINVVDVISRLANTRTSMLIIGMTQRMTNEDGLEDEMIIKPLANTAVVEGAAEDADGIIVDSKDLKEENPKEEEKENLGVKSKKQEEEGKNDDDDHNVMTKKKKVGRPRGSKNLPVKKDNDNAENVTYDEVWDVSKKFFEATIDIVGKIGGPAIKVVTTAIESNKTKEVFEGTGDAIKLVSASIDNNKTTEILKSTADLAGKLGGSAIKLASASIDKNKTTEILKSTADLAGKLGGSAMKIVSEAIDNNDERKEGIDAAIKAASAAIGNMNINMDIMKLLEQETIIDVSIPYDSASLLAYTEWLVTNGKKKEEEYPSYDNMEELRYGYFQTNYKKVTIANVIAKKNIRDRLFRKSIESKLLFEAKEDVVAEEKLREEFSVVIELDIKPIKLDKYADLSPTEYTEMMKSLEPKTLVGLLVDLATYTGKAALNVATSTVEGTKKIDSRSSIGSSSGSGTVFVKKKKKSTSVNAAKVQKKKIPNKTIVSSSKNKKQAAVKKPKLAVTTKSMFSFGGTKKVTKPPPTTLKPAAAARQQKKKVVAPKKKKVIGGVPELSKWKQNKDGSITGFISNSPSFFTGTRITTSSIPKGAKSGSTVRTGSGSRYKLN